MRGHALGGRVGACVVGARVRACAHVHVRGRGREMRADQRHRAAVASREDDDAQEAHDAPDAAVAAREQLGVVGRALAALLAQTYEKQLRAANVLAAWRERRTGPVTVRLAGLVVPTRI